MNIIQFGCNDSFDELYDFILSNKSKIKKLILVDANHYALEVSKERYSLILDPGTYILYNKAIVCDTSIKEINFYIPNKDLDSGHSSIFKELVALNWGEDLKCIKVEATTPETFLSLIDGSIDELHVDVEGLDADILLYIDLNKYNIKKIVFEAAHCDGYFTRKEKFNKVIDKLTANGYQLNWKSNNLDIEAIK